MSFFNLGDITFNKQSNQGFGPLAALEKTDYQYNTFKYPLDVGNYDKGHYMVIYIRTQNVTKGEPPANETSTTITNPAGAELGMASTLANAAKKSASKIDNYTNSQYAGQTINLASKVGNAGVSGVNSIFNDTKSFSSDTVVNNSIKKISDKSPFGFLDTTSRTTDAIALYMPDTLLFQSDQRYENLSPGNDLLGQALVNTPGLVDKFKTGTLDEGVIATLKSGAARTLAESFLSQKGGGQTAKLGLFAATGKVVNPMLELIYSAPEFRSFQFDFFFYPRSEAEAEEVQKVIERRRYHQAPELSLNDNGTQDGLLIPPSEFDLSFYYGGSENPNIPQIGTCVLEGIQLNYAPNGFSAYEVPGENTPTLGKTGMPVSIQMTLNFKETTYLTKMDFRKDLPSLR